MAGLAVLLQARGFRVSGCDLRATRITAWLARQGIAVATGHDRRHLRRDVRWIIRSAAVPARCEEITAAVAAGLPVFLRGRVLPALLRGCVSVAVAGTHGKTTTTAMIAHVLTRAGKAPSFCIGGEPSTLSGLAVQGASDILVVEADESDGTLALYRPEIGVVTSVELDHPDHFAGYEDVASCFGKFARQVRRRLFFCADEPGARAVCAGRPGACSYGVRAGADFRARGLKRTATATRFTVWHAGRALGRIDLPVPGMYNALNALAACAVALELGVPFMAIARGLAGFAPVRRRFELTVDRPDLTVVSDYAHHPTEIRAFCRAAAALKRGRAGARLLAVFQPHRYSRTRALLADFPAAFAGLDDLVLLPVYAASEAPEQGGTLWDLYAAFRKAGRRRVLLCAASLPQAWAWLRRRLDRRTILGVVGAGDVDTIARWASRALARGGPARLDPTGGWMHALQRMKLERTTVRRACPLARLTRLGVGGPADIFLGIESERDLASVLEWSYNRHVPFTLLGAGSNVLISDLGLRGLVARLGGPAFTAIRAERETMACGAGLALGRLMGWMEAHGRTGLEFLEGIPGTVGGAVRMNAGAWGGEIGAHVDWVRGRRPNGTEVHLAGNRLAFEYRNGVCVQGVSVVEVGLRTDRAAPAQIRAKRAEYAARRKWLLGKRTAGSMFKNPPRDYAGRLLEAAGLKGFTVGGARISRRHANICLARKNATASDVRALLEIARAAVARRYKVALANEIVVLGETDPPPGADGGDMTQWDC
ncbi:MAG: UDP-N-acetylmuramate--L-alanine ligase [Kiritimatiellae bacterium]|nr:UDP-N-acetylmuramate--L-alanine ligase [Kiritimatiellia bacterium]